MFKLNMVGAWFSGYTSRLVIVKLCVKILALAIRCKLFVSLIEKTEKNEKDVGDGHF